VRRKQPNIIESVLRTSTNPNNIILNAFEKIPDKSFCRFVQVAFNSRLFSGAFITKVETRKFEDFTAIRSPTFLNDVDDIKVFYLCLGILQKNEDKIKAFVEKEIDFNKSFLEGDNDSSNEKLNIINSEFGLSFWGEQSRLALLTLEKRSQDYVIPDVAKDNSIISILLNHLKGLAHDTHSEDDLFSELIEIYNKSDDSSNVSEVLKYKLIGVNPRLKLDLYKILKIELYGTLIDLYKAFESLCIQSILENTNQQIIDLSVQFLRRIKHESFGLQESENIKLSAYANELKIIDKYSESDYWGVIEDCEKAHINDIGMLNIYSKSLSFVGYRSLGNSFSTKISNLLADIFDKGERYKESTNLLNNLCYLLKSNYKFIALNNIIYNETFPDRNANDIHSSATIFSNIPTPFKLASLFGNNNTIDLYNKQMPTSDTFILFKRVEKYPLGVTRTSPRDIKYYAKKMYSIGEFEKALSLYDCNNIELDNEMKKDYLLTLVNCNQTIKAAEYFFDLSLKKPSAIKYFAISQLHSIILDKMNTVSSIYIALCLYLYRDIQNTSLNKAARAIAIKKYVRDMGVKRPSELSFFDDDKKTIMFLADVCNRDVLAKSMLFRYQKDAYDERIKICNLLSTRKLSNVDKLVFETKELSKRKVLENAALHVSSSKVYADKDFVRTNTWNEYRSYFDEYIIINNENSELEEQEEHLDQVSKMLNEQTLTKGITDPLVDLMSNQLKAFLNIGDDKKNKALFALSKCVIEEYCFGIKGLNGYLSTRIRHQTFFSTLLGPLINEEIVSDDKITKNNSFLSSIDTIEASILTSVLNEQVKFNDRITKVVNDLLFKNVQICAVGKGNVDCAFNYDVESEALEYFREKIGPSPSINESWQEIESWIVEHTNRGCNTIQNLIQNQLKNELEVALNEFELKIEKIIGESKTHCSSVMINTITKSRPLLFNQLNIVNSWFDIDHSYIEQEYTFDIVTDIAETMLSTKSLLSDKPPEIVVPHKLLSPLVDLLHNIFSNAIKYSDLEANKVKISLSATQENELINIIIKNNSGFNGDIDEENRRLDKYKHKLSPQELKSLLQKEGGSGIAKVKCILKHDLFSDGTIDLEYLNSDEFVISFSINKNSGIILNENTDS